MKPRTEVGGGGPCPDCGAIVAALEAGQQVVASNRHGIPQAWKQADGTYRVALLQHRSMAEEETFATAEAAAGWFREKFLLTDA